MIDEADLRELLQEAAGFFEIPAEGETRVLEAATPLVERAPRPPRWPRPRLAIGVAAALLAVAGIFLVGTVVGSRDRTPKFRSVGLPTGVGINGPNVAASDQGAAAGATSGGPGQASPGPPAQSTIPAPSGDTARVVKTGSVQIDVRKGAVGATVARLTNVATGLGGYVADTKTAEGGDNPTGSVTLRVPVGTFDNLVASVRGLGTVKSITTHGQDVTAQYTDIQARLTALNATRNQLLTILQKASAIGDILSVQDRINQVQTEIDQLQGQQKVLDDQTSYAALSVDVAQEGSVAPGPPAPKAGVAKAWDDARHGFTNGVETLLAHSGTALLVLLIAAAIAVAIRFGWPWVRRRLV